VKKSEPFAVGPFGNFESATGTIMAGVSFFIAVFFLATMVFGLLNPVPGQEPLALAPVVLLFLGFGTFGLVMRLRQTSVVYVDGWAPPRKTFRRPHNHRSFVKWQEIEHLKIRPDVSRMTVHLRTGESFRVKLKEVGPAVYQELVRRCLTITATG